ncbi:MAG: alpha/beta fold hydrolase [Planctomycetota bacterium]|nr:alpha/beta fold hydrolase [Planctomycetota bacterium]
MKNINIGELHLNVVDQGAGQPLLFIHGFPLDHTMWQFQIEDLSRDFRIIAPDLRGFGASELNDAPMSMAQFADDLDRLLSALEVDSPVNVCGLSMGGYIAWEFWRRHPQRLSRLILCDTRAAADDSDTQTTRRTTAERVLRDGTEFLAKMMIPKLFAQETLEQRSVLVEATRQRLLHTSPVTIAAALNGMAKREDATAWLSEIHIPALLLCGVSDSITPVAEMQQIAATLPNSRYATIPQAGHMAPLENPQACNLELRNFLEA